MSIRKQQNFLCERSVSHVRLHNMSNIWYLLDMLFSLFPIFLLNSCYPMFSAILLCLPCFAMFSYGLLTLSSVTAGINADPSRSPGRCSRQAWVSCGVPTSTLSHNSLCGNYGGARQTVTSFKCNLLQSMNILYFRTTTSQ